MYSAKGRVLYLPPPFPSNSEGFLSNVYLSQVNGLALSCVQVLYTV